MIAQRVRWAALGGLLGLISPACVCAQDNVLRSAPTRPGTTFSPPASIPPISSAKPKAEIYAPKQTPSSTRFGAAEWVEIGLGAKRLGLKVGWTLSSREVVLTDKDNRLELASDRLEVVLNGQRIFLGQAPVSRGGNLYLSKIDLERCLVPLVRPALLGVPKAAPKTIVIDPATAGLTPASSMGCSVYLRRPTRSILRCG